LNEKNLDPLTHGDNWSQSTRQEYAAVGQIIGEAPDLILLLEPIPDGWILHEDPAGIVRVIAGVDEKSPQVSSPRWEEQDNYLIGLRFEHSMPIYPW
jgi:hypothetical protein